LQKDGESDNHFGKCAATDLADGWAGYSKIGLFAISTDERARRSQKVPAFPLHDPHVRPIGVFTSWSSANSRREASLSFLPIATPVPDSPFQVNGIDDQELPLRILSKSPMVSIKHCLTSLPSIRPNVWCWRPYMSRSPFEQTFLGPFQLCSFHVSNPLVL
jgi:hypothetical protein